jgi:hypothetical protein
MCRRILCCVLRQSSIDNISIDTAAYIHDIVLFTGYFSFLFPLLGFFFFVSSAGFFSFLFPLLGFFFFVSSAGFFSFLFPLLGFSHQQVLFLFE